MLVYRTVLAYGPRVICVLVVRELCCGIGMGSSGVVRGGRGVILC